MIKIAADSTIDLGEISKTRNIHILPLAVILGNNNFYDGVTINPDDIYTFVEANNILPKTAARSEDEFKEFFKELTDDGSEVVFFSISAELSVTNNVAKSAAKQFDNVYVVDGRSLSTGTGLLVMHACDLRDKGLSAKEVYEDCLKRVPHVQASFFVNTMEYLHKGGRCSGLTNIVASVLKLKPELILKDGKIVVGKKFIGNGLKICNQYVDNIFSMYNKPDLTRIFITHTSAAKEIVEKVKERIKEHYQFNEIIETIAGSTVTSHCGKGTLGILFINDGERVENA